MSADRARDNFHFEPLHGTRTPAGRCPTDTRPYLPVMSWIGTWKNQYGSLLEITNDANENIEGWFTSAVDGGIRGQRIRISGFHRSDMVTFCLAGGPIVASFTGLLREDRLETLWHVTASEKDGRPLAVFQAFTTGADTFVRTG